MIKSLICFCLMSSTIFGDVLYWQLNVDNSYQFVNTLDFNSRNTLKFDLNWLTQFTSAFNDCQKHMFFEWLISDENVNWKLIDYTTKDEIELDWINLNNILN